MSNPENKTAQNAVQPDMRKMTSITRKLHFQLFWKKFGIYMGFNFLIVLLLGIGWILDQEFRAFGEFSFEHSRSLSMNDGFWSLQYNAYDSTGTELHAKASYMLFFILVVLGSLLVLEILFIAASWYSESKKIQKTLKPLNDIALRADAISRMTFSDAIYQTDVSPDESFRQLEIAIQELDPNQESMPSLDNRELQGIEAAMNNLLRRVHESYQQQARFVNDASHELRTPIAVIQGYANMLERWGRQDESVLNESITAITHEAKHMNQLVEQLLFLARGDAGRTKLKEEPINLNDMIQEIYEESLMIDEAHPYHLRKPEEPVMIIGDPMLLKQSVRILLDNAAKYTHEGNEIGLSVGLTESGAPFLQVQDSGIGMAEADVAHMFERFYRSDEAREFKGTGLGLAIAKWIVDRHRGHFEILSRTELGTRIRVVLPADCICTEETLKAKKPVDASEIDEFLKKYATIPTPKKKEEPSVDETEPSGSEAESSGSMTEPSESEPETKAVTKSGKETQNTPKSQKGQRLGSN